MDIESVLRAYPTAGLTIAPTLIRRLPRLSARLGCNVYVKREDLTGFALGGNKVRKLDYLIGDARLKKTDTLVTSGASSFSRNAASAGAMFAMEVHVLLQGSEEEQNPHSRQHFELSGAVLHFEEDGKEEPLDERMRILLGQLMKKKRRVYELHPGGSDRIGALGYVSAFKEIVNYSQTYDIQFQKIIIPTGSAGTQAGLMIGQCISGYETEIIGITISKRVTVQRNRVLKLALETASMLQLDLDANLLILDDRFLGDGYAIPTEAGRAAVELFARTEGLLLDDVYSGKAAAGLVHYCEQHQLSKADNVLFILTGGNAGLYY